MGNNTVLPSRNASKMVKQIKRQRGKDFPQFQKIALHIPLPDSSKVNRSSRSQNTAARFMMPDSDKQGGSIYSVEMVHTAGRGVHTDRVPR